MVLSLCVVSLLLAAIAAQAVVRELGDRGSVGDVSGIMPYVAYYWLFAFFLVLVC